jgi:hypothetical protein
VKHMPLLRRIFLFTYLRFVPVDSRMERQKPVVGKQTNERTVFGCCVCVCVDTNRYFLLNARK